MHCAVNIVILILPILYSGLYIILLLLEVETILLFVVANNEC